MDLIGKINNKKGSEEPYCLSFKKLMLQMEYIQYQLLLNQLDQ